MNRRWLWWAVLIIAGLGLTMMTVVQQREVHNSKAEPISNHLIEKVERKTYSSLDKAQEAIGKVLYQDVKLDSYGYAGGGNQYIGTVNYQKGNHHYVTLYYYVRVKDQFKLFIGRHDVKVTGEIKSWRDHAGIYTYECRVGPHDKGVIAEKDYNDLNMIGEDSALSVKKVNN